jgi:hypothetical protein
MSLTTDTRGSRPKMNEDKEPPIREKFHEQLTATIHTHMHTYRELFNAICAD